MADYSIVIPLYQKQELIRRAIASAQRAIGNRSAEIVVVDDGSTDEGPAVTRGLAVRDPRIRLIRQPNSGAATARNRGVAEAGADLVCFLDADDEWRENHLDVIEGLIARFPQAGTFATAHCLAWPNGTIERLPFRGVPADPEGGIIERYFEAARTSAVWTSSICMRRSVFEAAGGFPAELSVGQDIVCWAAASLVAPVAWSPKVTAIYHREATNYSFQRWNPHRHRMLIDAFRGLAARPGLDEASRAEIEAHCQHQMELAVKMAKYGGYDRLAFRALGEVLRARGLWHARWLVLRCLIPSRALSVLSDVKRRARGMAQP